MFGVRRTFAHLPSVAEARTATSCSRGESRYPSPGGGTRGGSRGGGGEPVGDLQVRSGRYPASERSRGRGDRTRTGGMGASNRPLTRCDRQDATTSATSWGLSGAEIPACEPVALADAQTACVSGQHALHLFHSHAEFRMLAEAQDSARATRLVMMSNGSRPSPLETAGRYEEIRGIPAFSDTRAEVRRERSESREQCGSDTR